MLGHDINESLFCFHNWLRGDIKYNDNIFLSINLDIYTAWFIFISRSEHFSLNIFWYVNFLCNHKFESIKFYWWKEYIDCLQNLAEMFLYILFSRYVLWYKIRNCSNLFWINFSRLSDQYKIDGHEGGLPVLSTMMVFSRTEAYTHARARTHTHQCSNW